MIDGALAGDLFEAYVNPLLAAEIRPEDLLVLDNRSAHKTARVKAALERQGIAY